MFIHIMYIQCMTLQFFFTPFANSCYCMFIQYLAGEDV
ncbi:Uncharacterised protein [Enterobacter hormaechei]|nr:hypothetical protein P826_01065 [Enterobacter hormaechei]SAF44405.1 Uncharacterised protein [Enterobacter hormaechei]SAG96234.1 Uncharacterised protein [Enterobacter hormaechei]VAF15598.1 Uncharacterised protein [Enterobacter hormaechei]